MRETYGVSSAMPFEKGDPVELRQDVNSKQSDGTFLKQSYCRDRFEIFVSKGQEVKIGEIVPQRFRPSSLDGEINFTLWASATNPAPRYANTKFQPDVRILATMTVVTKTIPNFGCEGVEVRIRFGETMIDFLVRDLATKQDLKPHSVKFLSQ